MWLDDAASDAQLLALRMCRGAAAPKIRARALLLGGRAVGMGDRCGGELPGQFAAFPPEQRPNPTAFTLKYGPWIIVATVVLPA